MQTQQFALLVGSMVLLSAIATANSLSLSARDVFQKMGVLVTELPAELPPESLVQHIAQTEVELVLMSSRLPRPRFSMPIDRSGASLERKSLCNLTCNPVHEDRVSKASVPAASVPEGGGGTLGWSR